MMSEASAVRFAKGTLLLAIGVLLGVIGSQAYGAAAYFGSQDDWRASADGVYDGIYEQPEGNQLTAMMIGVTGAQERPGPADRIPENDIGVFNDRVVIGVKGAQWLSLIHISEPTRPY